MSSCIDRVDGVIKITSPSGQYFEALWQGSARSAEKKLGIYDYPRFKGSIVQDLNVKAVRYPMKIYFQGPDHDKTADKFFKCVSEYGPWQVIHPTKGKLNLQMVSITEDTMPVEHLNYTMFILEWLEPAKENPILSMILSADSVIGKALTTIQSFQNQFNQILQLSFSAIDAVSGMIDVVTGIITSSLGMVTNLVSGVQGSFDQAVRSLDDLLDASILDPLAVAAQVTSLATIPAQAMTDFKDSYSYISNAVDLTIAQLPDQASDKAFNQACVIEMVLGSLFTSACQLSATSDYTTRADVIYAMESLTDMFSSIVDNLDDVQNLFITSNIERQYFSNSQAFGDMLILFGLTMQSLIASIFDLAIEKRFTLQTARSPIEITASEYGSFGDNDSNYDLFIQSNGLSGNDILILPPGREVVVYA
jgi:hypothetical protein